MKEGTRIIYVDSRREERPATVVAVTGTGPSLNKRVDLRFGPRDADVRKDVPHREDAAASGTYWKVAPPLRDGLTDEERAALPRPAPPMPRVLGHDYVYEGDPEEEPARGPGVGGGGGKEPTPGEPSSLSDVPLPPVATDDKYEVGITPRKGKQ
jgi:hypothetical protein